MENLLRTYTAQELNDLFEKTGFPEISKQYCIEKYNEKYTEHRKYDIDEEELQRGKEALLEYLMDACCWDVETLRERAWEATLEELKIETYIQQRESGHCHEWSKLFCDKMVEFDLKENDVKTYYHTYQTFIELRKEEECFIDSHGYVLKRKKDTLSDREFILAVKILAKDEGEIVERFIGNWLTSPQYEGTVEELFQEAVLFKKLYSEFRTEGIPDDEAWEYASELTTETADSIKSFIYKEAIKNKAPFMEAYKFTLFCEEIIRICEETKTGWFTSYYSRVAVAFTEKWQKQILADLIIKNQPQNWRWPDFDKDIKQSFGLEYIEEI